MVFVLLKVGEGDFEDSAFEGVVGVLETGGAVDEGFADAGDIVSFYASGVERCISYSRTLNVDGA
jgi:hypothetical protein